MAKGIVALFLDGWADWEAGPALAGMREWLGGAEVTAATLDGRPVRSIGGVTLQPDRGIAEVDQTAADLWILVGSDAWWQHGPFVPVTAALQARAQAGKPSAGICAGTLALAAAGLLDDRPHTSNSLEFLTRHAPAYCGQGHYQDRPCVGDGLVITAPGSAPIAFAATIFRTLVPEQEEVIAEFEREFAKEHRAG
ncbi:DJ-1/PfpI family protein [Inquilinus limosus]|uniref:DJ-1/PfpI family protein n=1 Tax=Inquilinus limosus TaxID=171674 RepID=UPI003F15032C